MTTINNEDLEDTLLADESFQHILKFAPESQRELMTYELATYFEALIARKVGEAERESYKKGYNAGWIRANKVLKPQKYGYFAKQLEETAKSLRVMEKQLNSKDNLDSKGGE